MSDRPTAANGKAHPWWGSLKTCPACGQCLCFGCHPKGPCVDERQASWLATPVPRGGPREQAAS